LQIVVFPLGTASDEDQRRIYLERVREERLVVLVTAELSSGVLVDELICVEQFDEVPLS